MGQNIRVTCSTEP